VVAWLRVAQFFWNVCSFAFGWWICVRSM